MDEEMIEVLREIVEELKELNKKIDGITSTVAEDISGIRDKLDDISESSVA